MIDAHEPDARGGVYVDGRSPREGGGEPALARLSRALATPGAWIGVAVALRVWLGVWGIAHYAYMGQDFQIHLDVLETVWTGFRWGGTNPPLLYAVASLVRRYVAPRFFLEVTSLFFLAINVAVVPLVTRALGRLGLSPRARTLGTILLLFMPFWVVHTAVFAADVFSVPLFFAIAELLCRLYEERGDIRRELAILAGLGVTLAAAVLAKYTFFYVLALAAVLVAWRYRKEPLRLVPAALVAGLLPGAIALHEFHELERARSYVRYGAYAPPAGDYPQASPMRMRDIFLPKRADLRLLDAPLFYADKLYEPYRYSYPGLLHVSSFTDVLGYFQPAPKGVPVWNPKERLEHEAGLLAHPNAFSKPRTWIARWASPLAVVLSLPLTALAVWGTLCALWRALLGILRRRDRAEDGRAILLALALAFYVPVAALLPRVTHAYTFAYWLPRLVMPSLLVFLACGLVELGRIARPFAWAQRLAPAATAALAAVYILAV